MKPHPTDRQARLDRFEALCREHGLALTVQRRTIYEAVLDRTDHPTAEEVYRIVEARIPGVSRTTVYRVLDTLVAIGVLGRACSPGTASRFDPMLQRHHHLVCMRCERLIDLEDERLAVQVPLPDVQSYGFEIYNLSIHFQGLCADCRAAAPAPKRSAAAGARPAAGKTTGGAGGQRSRTRKRS